MAVEYERVNYHGHCNYCRHARGTAREYVLEAVRQRLVRMGFTDHLPFPDDRFGNRMPYAEQAQYLQEITELKEEFADRLELLRGFEGEYVRDNRQYYEELLSLEQCEYLILGQHHYETAEGDWFCIYGLDNTEQYVDYSRNVVEAMRTGYFRYAAHPDVIFLNDFSWDRNCDEACDIIIDGAVKYGFPLEFNANGLRRERQIYADGERYPYPHRRFWDKVKNTGIRVYVGSDCHDPEHVYDEYVVRSYEILADMGIPVCTEL